MSTVGFYLIVYVTKANWTLACMIESSARRDFYKSDITLYLILKQFFRKTYAP